ncbi:MAG: carbon-nitrogen hydrolase family protein [Bacteroidota bacterium]
MLISLAQIIPVWLDKAGTLSKILDYTSQAADAGAKLVCFGESLLPGYPFWLSITGGAAFNDRVQKEIHAHYLSQAVDIEAGDLEPLCQLTKQRGIAVYVGIIERPLDRGGHSCYCSLVYVDANGVIQSVHRKLQPTYEERLCWSPGDGHGLRVHELGDGWRVGGLNCWENWMPLARTALYAQGENIHVSVWPGGLHNTHDLTKFIAKESRSYVVAVSGLLSKEDLAKRRELAETLGNEAQKSDSDVKMHLYGYPAQHPKNSDSNSGTPPAEVQKEQPIKVEETTTIPIPHLDLMIENSPEWLANGASCIAAPDGSWLIEPQLERECLLTAELDLQKVYEERQNFDPTGHYSRPSVTKLMVDRSRQSSAEFRD